MVRRDIPCEYSNWCRGSADTARCTDKRRRARASSDILMPRAASRKRCVVERLRNIRSCLFPSWRQPLGDLAWHTLLVIPERPCPLDRLVGVFGAGDLPITTTLADIRNVSPAMFAVRFAQLFAEPPPCFFNRDLVDVASF